MRRLPPFGLAPLLAALLSCAPADAQQPQIGRAPQGAADEFITAPGGINVQSWVENLDAPWSLVFLPDGRALVSERTGRIRLIDRGRLLPEPVVAIATAQGGEQGLFGLALHPAFPAQPYLYAMYTAPGGARNQVLRLIFDGAHARPDRVIVDGIPAGRSHDGGRIAFGPDGNLYVAIGETFRAELAQDMSSLGGKLLRVTADGAVPADNPFANSPILSLGHRNIQGLAWEPGSKQLFMAEHGPSGEFGLQAWDEINVLRPGANYGWPRVVGAPASPAYVDPIAAWPDTAIAPSGMTFWKGDLYVAALRGNALIQLQLDRGDGAWRVKRIERWFANNRTSGRFGRLRDAVVGPDGALYVLTNNRDGRGRPTAGDDRILRIETGPLR